MQELVRGTYLRFESSQSRVRRGRLAKEEGVWFCVGNLVRGVQPVCLDSDRILIPFEEQDIVMRCSVCFRF